MAPQDEVQNLWEKAKAYDSLRKQLATKSIGKNLKIHQVAQLKTALLMFLGLGSKLPRTCLF